MTSRLFAIFGEMTAVTFSLAIASPLMATLVSRSGRGCLHEDNHAVHIIIIWSLQNNSNFLIFLNFSQFLTKLKKLEGLDGIPIISLFFYITFVIFNHNVENSAA